jgi:chromosome segregation ATPase
MRNLRRQLEQLRRDLEEVQKLHREALEEIRRSNRELADIKNGRGWKIANGTNAAIIKARSIFKRDDPSTPPK